MVRPSSSQLTSQSAGVATKKPGEIKFSAELSDLSAVPTGAALRAPEVILGG